MDSVVRALLSIARDARYGVATAQRNDRGIGRTVPHTWDPRSPSPEEALQRLLHGIRRCSERSSAPLARTWNVQMATDAQRPFAIVLGCSDSRTPVEIVFDAGFGELFVIPTPGH